MDNGASIQPPVPLNKALRRVMAVDESLGVPMCIYWDTPQMAEWIEQIGYSKYKECFEKNLVTGRHLIALDASVLPAMGITDFEHIKDITAQIRALLGHTQIIRNMNVAMGDPMIAYLDQKRRTGRRTQNTSYQTFLTNNKRWFKKDKSDNMLFR